MKHNHINDGSTTESTELVNPAIPQHIDLSNTNISFVPKYFKTFVRQPDIPLSTIKNLLHQSSYWRLALKVISFVKEYYKREIFIKYYLQ